MSKTVFFVSSSDNTHDVFEIIGKNLVLSLPVDFYDIYVGLNSKTAIDPYKVVRTEAKGWMEELRCQLQQLPKSVTNVILLLDDFWFYEAVSENQLKVFIDTFEQLDADYLRLVPLKRSAVMTFVRNIKKWFVGNSRIVEKISKYEPYYSSLQVAIWRRDYLEMLLSKNVSIWNFEHLNIKDSKHFAVTNKFCFYSHLVEKGKWYPFALKLFKKIDEGNKIIRPVNLSYNKFRIAYDKFKFDLFGYSIFQTKRFISFAKNKFINIFN